MNQIKQKIINVVSSDNTTKKFQKIFNKKRNSINCIENFPNELFYEIFDYLEGCSLYEAFSYLNTRFEDLLTCSSFRLRINFTSYSGLVLEHRSKHIVIPNKDRIISFCFINAFGESPILTWFPIDSGFNHLESLTLTDISEGELLLILVGLIFLPRLFSLTINLEYRRVDLNYVYQMIFNLPKLKYNKLSLKESKTIITLPIATDNQFSMIEYLVIDHPYTLEDLIIILSYTPRLSHLICKRTLKSNRNIGQKVPIKLLKLISVSIDYSYLYFDELEIFIKNIFSQLQVLRINAYRDAVHLDADRWEQLIIKYIPHLRLFNLKYIEHINEHLQITPYHARIDRFTSSFWIKRKWFFELFIDTNSHQDMVVIYSIYQYRGDFHEYEGHDNSFFRKCSQTTVEPYQHGCTDSPNTFIQLTVSNLRAIDLGKSFIDIIRPILILTLITKLNITFDEIFVGILIKLMHLLPNLHCLVVKSLAMIQIRCLTTEETKILRFVSNNNKITKVKFQSMTELAQIQFLMNLCPRMQHLEVTCINDIDPQLFIRFILTKNTKYIPNLCSLCFAISKLSDDILEKLQKTIELEKLHDDYTINQLNNKIYLRWNKK